MRTSVMEYYTGKHNHHIHTTGVSSLMSNFYMVFLMSETGISVI